MKIAFITVNFKGDTDTLSLVKDIRDNLLPSGTSVTHYIVDNGQSKDLEEKLKTYKDAVYIKSPNNLGFAAGNNLGLKKALADKSDILVMINDDTIAPKDLVRNILNSPIKEAGVGLVGGLIYFAKGYEFEKGYKESDKGNVIWYAGGQYDWDNIYASHIGVNEVDRGQYKDIKPTDFVTGCLFITKADVLRKTGLFNEKYCLYFEDSDLCLRIKKKGLMVMFDPGIKLWHKVAQSSGIGSPLNDYFLTRNRILFGMTYARLRTKIALMRESFRKLFTGTPAQKLAVYDYLTGNLGKGSFLK